jgi:hypothetical protein
VLGGRKPIVRFATGEAGRQDLRLSARQHAYITVELNLDTDWFEFRTGEVRSLGPKIAKVLRHCATQSLSSQR